MRDPIDEAGLSRRTWLRRVAWMLAIWAASVTALAAIAGVLRLLMNAAGLTR